MFVSWTFGKKLGAGFGMAGVVLLVIALFGYRSTRDLIENQRWVAHTPGSQMMTVKLKNTGLIILTGDNVYFRENVDKSIAPNLVLAYDPAGFYRAYEWIRMMMATQKADYFTAHDPDAFKALKKAPAYYD